MLQYSNYPAGTIPASADGKKQWAIEHAQSSFAKAGVRTLSEKDIKVGDVPGMQYEVMFKGRKATIRVFADNNVYYVLTALPVPNHAGPTIEKLFDSFEFVKP